MDNDEGMNRFDLEQTIMDCWRVVDDVSLVLEYVLESEDPVDKDRISNMLLGITELYELKFNKLHKLFTEVVTRA